MTMIDRDFHMHTDLSTCAARDATMSRMVAAAREAGLKYVGISDHFHELNRAFGAMVDGNRRLMDEEKAKVPGISLFLGGEAQMDSPASCTMKPEIAEPLDYVLCACNHYHQRQVENPADRSPVGYARHYLQMVEGAIDTGFVDVIVHPFLHDKVRADHRAILDAYDKQELDRILDKAAAAGVAFELNPDHAISAADWFRDVYRSFCERGGKISLGSDSHAPAELGYRRADRPGERFAWDDLTGIFGLRPENLFLPRAGDAH